MIGFYPIFYYIDIIPCKGILMEKLYTSYNNEMKAHFHNLFELIEFK